MSKILVVDDQYMNRDLLVRRLGSKGFEAVEANSGQSALDILYKEEVDLILLDIHMPNMDGNEVLQKVRDIHSALELPIIMVTANVNSLSIIKSIDLGADDYVTKPVDFPVLLSKIKNKLFISNIAKQNKLLKHELEIKNKQIEEKNDEILNSIRYAKRIQQAILLPERLFESHFPNSFILNRPKNIVSGDFYWIKRIEKKTYFAVADCTGHGVPGAMISIICNNSLNRCVSDYSISKLGEILDKTRELIVDEFKLSEEEVLDGMDISICSIEGQQFSYAGANNPLWLIRNRNEECRTDSSNESLVLNMENREYQLFEVKADKQPVGRYDVMKPFVTHEIQVNKGDVIYLFSDGFVDQFGGDNDKKYKAKRFKDLLLSIQDNDMKQQKELITSAFFNWKGDNEQTDDICVLGLTI